MALGTEENGRGLKTHLPLLFLLVPGTHMCAQYHLQTFSHTTSKET